MTLRSALQLGLVWIAVAATFGCDQGRQAPAKTNVQVVHAAPSAPVFDFRRENERTVQENVTYGTATGVLAYDEDTYDFHVETDVLAPGSITVERHSFTATVSTGTEYTFVITEVGGVLEPIILESPPPEAGGNAQVRAVHAAPGQGAVDVFVEAASADLTTSTPLASLSFTQSIAPATRAAGDYVVTLTEPGNPANVLFQSNPVPLPGGVRSLLVIIDAAGEGTDTRRVVLVQGSSAVLTDKNATSAVRIVNAAADGAARDVAVGGQFSPPLFTAVPAGAVSAYAPVTPGDNELSVTPAGNPGVVEATQKISAAPGRVYTAIVAGAPGSLTAAAVLDDRRPIADRARLALLNGASQFTSLRFYLLAPGGDPSTANPAAVMAAPGASQYFELPAGTHEIVVRNDQDVTVAGPTSITVANGGIYAVLATNGADASTASIVLLEGF